MAIDFTTVTEMAGTQVSAEQVERLYHRYYWAEQYCRDKDVLEVACGNGMGIGYLGSISRSMKAGDIDPVLVEETKKHYGDRYSIAVMDAQSLPVEEDSLDVILIYEAIYYLPDVDKFFLECKRALRKNGVVLVVTTNKDRQDFNPSPYSVKYYGTAELDEVTHKHGFDCEVFGYWPVKQASLIHKILRPVKIGLVKSGLMPKTMAGKQLLKRIVFGKLVEMPTEIQAGKISFVSPTMLDIKVKDTSHTVLYCAARLQNK